MPSRPVVALVFVFWAASLGLVFYRDLWPRLAASGPPPIAVDLSDEASQFVPVRWAVTRGDQKAGKLTTKMTYQDADDTFVFAHQYVALTFDFANFRVVFPEVILTTRMTRAGDLREQTMDGRVMLQLSTDGGSFRTAAEAAAKVRGRVENWVFAGRCELAGLGLDGTYALDPVPVPEGQALGPLQPVNRLAGVRPGQRWTVHEIDPLGEAVGTLARQGAAKFGFRPPEAKRDVLVAEVGSAPEVLRWRGENVPCWVIEYRAADPKARTWVRVSDGKVLRQEAFGGGERMALEREE